MLETIAGLAVLAAAYWVLSRLRRGRGLLAPRHSLALPDGSRLDLDEPEWRTLRLYVPEIAAGQLPPETVPVVHWVLEGVATGRLKLGDTAGAQDTCRRLLKIAPERALAYYVLARVAQNAGAVTEAWSFLRTAIRRLQNQSPATAVWHQRLRGDWAWLPVEVQLFAVEMALWYDEILLYLRTIIRCMEAPAPDDEAWTISLVAAVDYLTSCSRKPEHVQPPPSMLMVHRAATRLLAPWASNRDRIATTIRQPETQNLVRELVTVTTQAMEMLGTMYLCSVKVLECQMFPTREEA